MQKTKKDFYRLLFRSIAVFCAFVLVVGVITQGLYAASPVEFTSDLSEMKNVPAHYLYLTAQNFEDGSTTTSIIDIRTGDKILEGDYNYAGSYVFGSDVQYIFEGLSRGEPQAVYEVSPRGVSKLDLAPAQLKYINTAIAYNDKYGLFMYNTYVDKEINFEFYIYDKETQEYTQVNTSAIDSKYLTGKDELGNPAYWASFYTNAPFGQSEYAVIDFSSDTDLRTGSGSSARYSYVPETEAITLIEQDDSKGYGSPLPGQVHLAEVESVDLNLSTGEMLGSMLTAPITLFYQALSMVTTIPKEYYFYEESIIHYSGETDLPQGPYAYVTQPVYGKQKLILGKDSSKVDQERVVAEWFSTRYHYYTRFISIPESEEYVIVQISNKFGLLEVSTGKFALLNDFDEVVELDEYNDFTTGKVMVEVF